METLPQLGYFRYGTLGADPEVFLRKDGKIISSDKLIPKEGIISGKGKIVRDGIQVELQPTGTYYCRQEASLALIHLIVELQTLAKKEGMEVSWDQVITLSDEEWKDIPEECRILGCNPSLNIYGERPITVDVNTYRVRSAGGHIHLGLRHIDMTAPPGRLVALMDLFVGIPSVLLNRDSRAAERRENYGRAGEYRIQPHGVEYRTLSNFWLRSYVLTSLIYGLAREALCVQLGYTENVYIPSKPDAWAPDLLSKFNGEEVEKAINTNDLKLAEEQFGKLEEWLLSTTVNWAHPLAKKEDFDNIRKISQEGIDAYWPSIEAGWDEYYEVALKGNYHHVNGWENSSRGGFFNMNTQMRKAA